MKTSALKYGILSWVSGLTMAIILLMPFHAFLTVWASSMFGHYTAFRLWKEVLLMVAGAGAIFLAATDHKIRTHTLTRRLVWVILAYITLNIIWGVVALTGGDVTSKAFGYGLIIDLRFLVFFLITWAAALRTSRLRANWQWVVLWPAAVVALFGVLQAFVLPQDFLSHFGYGPHTIPAYETINHNSYYLRATSTLRGANPLGAYLIIPISILAVCVMRGKRTWQYAALMLGALISLFFSFSRSAWIGAFASVVIILVVSPKSKNMKRALLWASGLMIVLVAGLGIGLRHNTRFENVFFHTETHSAIKTSSNQGHLSALKNGLHDVLDKPIGDGPGTAGPASVYNPKETRIAENYFIQVGQETGLLGLGLFMLITAGVGYLLWLRRDDPLALSLFAALVGLTVVNLLSHAWADDTLAYVWWGLAGIAMAPIITKDKKL